MIMTSLVLLGLPIIAAQPELTFEGAPRHPTVYVTPADVQRAKERIETDPAARKWFESLKESVSAWDAKTPEWVRAVTPDKGACFAYGFTGCPICGEKWGTWGSART